MAEEIPKSIDYKDDKSRIAFQRLLLSKQLYLHGLEHSNNAGRLDKMIAVHNFHNAIEIVLKAIILHYDVRSEKQLNITFEQMITEVNGHQLFKDSKVVLPCLREIHILNQQRNHVQHHGLEPESSSMDYWRVYSRDFLAQVCQAYFGKLFDDLSPVDMIDNYYLRELLKISLLCANENKPSKSIVLSTMAFEWGRKAIFGVLPKENKKYLVISQKCEIQGPLINAFQSLEEKTNNAIYFSALLSSGIKLVDYRRFQSITPPVDFAVNGTPYCYHHKEYSDLSSARWAHEFAVNAIIHWQTLGLNPGIPDQCAEATQKIIEDQGAMFD